MLFCFSKISFCGFGFQCSDGQRSGKDAEKNQKKIAFQNVLTLNLWSRGRPNSKDTRKSSSEYKLLKCI